MSEFHPSRPPSVRTPARLRRRKLLEAWPHLIWVGMAALAFSIHSRGTSFVRMNGAVDVLHQYITAPEDGTIARLLVEPGQVVAPGTIVAEMDSRALQHQLEAMLQGIASSRREEVLRLDRIRIDLDAELRNYRIALAESNGRLGPLQRFLTKVQGNAAKAQQVPARGSGLAELRVAVNFPQLMPADLNALESEIGEIASRIDAVQENMVAVEKELLALNGTIGVISEASASALRAGSEEASVELLSGFSDAERTEYRELKAQISACQLRSGQGGVVDRIDRHPGDYARAGESIVQVVAETGKIVGFLPQANLGRLQVGDTVWVSPAHDRNAVYQTEVTNISSRISSLLDASSPLPNQRIYGRNIVVRFPEAAGGSPPRLAPGQSVTVHTSRPGGVPMLNRLFPRDQTVP
jgi:multidrug resistance efflux pump